jgi:hypothetical protein
MNGAEGGHHLYFNHKKQNGTQTKINQFYLFDLETTD